VGAPPRRPWTEAEIAHLRWYAERGLSHAEAAKLMDRSHASVAMHASRLGIRFTGPSGAPFGNDNRKRGCP